MVTSAFADLDTRRIEVAEVLRRLDEDLEVPVAAAVAVVRHIAILGLLVFSLLALVSVYCFTLTWLLLLWFQAQLLVFTAHLLSSTMEEPLPTHQAGFVSENQATVIPGDIATKQSITSLKRSQAAEFLPILEQGAQADIREPPRDTKTQLPDLEPGNHSKKYTQNESESSTTLDLLLPERSSSWPGLVDSAQKTTTPNVDPDNVPATSTMCAEERKKPEEDKRGSKRSSFVSMILNRPNGSTKQPSTKATLRPNPFNTTPQNLAEARSFSAEVGKPGARKARSAARVRPPSARTTSKHVTVGQAMAQPSMPCTRSEGWVPPHKRKTVGAQAQKPAAAVVINATAIESGLDTISAEAEANSRLPLFVDHDTSQAMFQQHNMETLANGASVTDATMPPEEQGPTQYGSKVVTSPGDVTHSSPLFDPNDMASGTHEQESSIKGPSGTRELRSDSHHGAAATKAPSKFSMSNAKLKALATESAVGAELASRLQSARHTILCPGNPCTASDCEHKRTMKLPRYSLSLKQEQAKNNDIEEVVNVVHQRLTHSASLTEHNIKLHSHYDEGEVSTEVPTSFPTAGEGAMAPQQDRDVVQLSILDMPEYCDPDLLSFMPKWSSSIEWQSNTFQASTEAQQPTLRIVMPPGLGHAVDRQAEFDALVPDMELATSECDTTRMGTGTGTSDLSHLCRGTDCASDSRVMLTDTTVKQSAQTEPGFNELEPYTSYASAVQAVGSPSTHTFVTKPDGEDSIPGTTNNAFGPAVEEAEIYNAMAASKRQAREMRKAARSLLKRGWLARETARKKVLLSGFACDVAQILAPATRSYLSYRSELEKLMPGGCLNEEDAKVYPVFSETDLAKPKSRPEGLQDVQDIETAVDVAPAAQVEPPLDENVVDKAKTSLATARKLHLGALDYFKHPDHSMQYAVWKSKGDNKLQRATAYYAKKREALVSAYGASGLPAEMKDLFPPP